MRARSLGIAFVVVLGCSETKPERPKLSDSRGIESARPSATAVRPSATGTTPPAPTASAEVDVSYPDDTIAAPSGAPISGPNTPTAEEIIQEYAKSAASLRSRAGKDGVRIAGVKADSALSRIGIKNGDSLKDINGFDMSDPDSALDAYAKLRRAARLDIHLVRDGKPLTIAVLPRRP